MKLLASLALCLIYVQCIQTTAEINKAGFEPLKYLESNKNLYDLRDRNKIYKLPILTHLDTMGDTLT